MAISTKPLENATLSVETKTDTNSSMESMDDSFFSELGDLPGFESLDLFEMNSSNELTGKPSWVDIDPAILAQNFRFDSFDETQSTLDQDLLNLEPVLLDSSVIAPSLLEKPLMPVNKPSVIFSMVAPAVPQRESNNEPKYENERQTDIAESQPLRQSLKRAAKDRVLRNQQLISEPKTSTEEALHSRGKKRKKPEASNQDPNPTKEKKAKSESRKMEKSQFNKEKREANLCRTKEKELLLYKKFVEDRSTNGSKKYSSRAAFASARPRRHGRFVSINLQNPSEPTPFEFS